MTTAFLPGFLLGLSLIMAIGAQNASCCARDCARNTCSSSA